MSIFVYHTKVQQPRMTGSVVLSLPYEVTKHFRLQHLNFTQGCWNTDEWASSRTCLKTRETKQWICAWLPDMCYTTNGFKKQECTEARFLGIHKSDISAFRPPALPSTNHICIVCINMDVSENSGTPKSSILIGFSIINHPFWGTPILGNTHMFIFTYDHMLQWKMASSKMRGTTLS